jgi:hypothetical protein
LGLTSCESVPLAEDVPADLSSAELIQLAQTSYDKGRVATAELYYNVLIARFYDVLPVRLSGEFEIAHIKIKQKKWEEAISLLTLVNSYYEGENGYALPPEYSKLVALDMKKVPKKYLPPEPSAE